MKNARWNAIYLEPYSCSVPSMRGQMKCGKPITCLSHPGSPSDLWGVQFCLSAFLTHPRKMSTTGTDFKQYSLLICYFSSQIWAMPHYFLYTVSVLEPVRKKIVKRRNFLVQHWRQRIQYIYFNTLPKEPLVFKMFEKH